VTQKVLCNRFFERKKGVKEPIVFQELDRIAVIAPHPDDECFGASAALLLAPDRTDIYVVSDGSHGDPSKSIEEETGVRKRQFEAEMEYVKPRSWHWLGYEDTQLAQNLHALDEIDFTVYTKIFMPWIESYHPDHRAVARMCRRVIRAQKASAECFSYEITAPFYRPTHYIDITKIESEKRKLIRFHADQLGSGQEGITMSLNAFRCAYYYNYPRSGYAEAYLQVDAWDMADVTDHAL
jgi:LmbE family N-acetylglucosaminyl deacetylase